VQIGNGRREPPAARRRDHVGMRQGIGKRAADRANASRFRGGRDCVGRGRDGDPAWPRHAGGGAARARAARRGDGDGAAAPGYAETRRFLGRVEPMRAPPPSLRARRPDRRDDGRGGRARRRRGGGGAARRRAPRGGAERLEAQRAGAGRRGGARAADLGAAAGAVRPRHQRASAATRRGWGWRRPRRRSGRRRRSSRASRSTSTSRCCARPSPAPSRRAIFTRVQWSRRAGRC
jgi:hypothetical protein